MKVGFMVYSLQGGGAERMVSRLANAFIGEGCEVKIFLFDTSKLAYVLDENIQVVSCEMDRTTNKVIKSIKRVYKLRKAIQKEQIDIMLAFTISMVPFALLATIGTKVRVIGAERTNPKILGKNYRFIIKTMAPMCAGYIFQTEGAKKCYPVSVQNKACIIGNVAPMGPLVIPSEDMQYNICSAGRLNREKDFKTLIQAFAQVTTMCEKARLTIFGEGDQKEELVALVKTLGLEEKVYFEGFVKNILECMREYSIFVFSSRAEGMPNVLVEAMSVGLACVSTDCEFGPSEVISDGINGYLVPVGDSDSMAERITWLLEHPVERLKISREAIKVREMYSEEQIVSKYLDYMREVCMK